MEPQYQWEYSGIVVIPRTGQEQGGSIELPFVVISSGNEAQLTNFEIDSAAMSIAQQYLSAFETSDPTRRQEFGTPTQIFLISIVAVEI